LFSRPTPNVRKKLRIRKSFVPSKKFTALVFMPQSSQPSVPVGSTVIYAPPPSKRFYYSEDQREKIEEEVSKVPEVSVYLADPDDLEVIPRKCDPAVVAFHESPVPVPFPVPAYSLPSVSETQKKIVRKKIMGGDKMDLSR
jgi:hypothetical protein